MTGRIIWRLAGKKNDFALGDGVRFAWQHDARGHPDDIITLFDDEGDPPEAKQSRGLTLNVDERAMTAQLVAQYYHPAKKLLAGSQGSLQVLPNGDVLVGWGSEPYYTEFRNDGTLVLDAEFAGGQSYRAFRFPWIGTPTEAPAVAVSREGVGHLTVYASWNGSTETAIWQALAGGSPSELAPVAALAVDGVRDVGPGGRQRLLRGGPCPRCFRGRAGHVAGDQGLTEGSVENSGAGRRGRATHTGRPVK